MKYAKIVLADQLIFKPHGVFTNANVSRWIEKFSVEEGWGMNIDEMGYGESFSVCRKLDLASKQDTLNKWISRFNKQ
jgi:hypothetical protein